MDITDMNIPTYGLLRHLNSVHVQFSLLFPDPVHECYLKDPCRLWSVLGLHNCRRATAVVAPHQSTRSPHSPLRVPSQLLVIPGHSAERHPGKNATEPDCQLARLCRRPVAGLQGNGRRQVSQRGIGAHPGDAPL